MKESIWAYALFFVGIAVVAIMLVVSKMTTNAEEDYYLGREVLEASMLDAIDYATFRTTGRVVMSEKKFIEVYIRRFADSVTNSQSYKLEFYDVIEEPPKASVRIRTESGTTSINSDELTVNVDTLLNGILETNYEQYMGYDDSKSYGKSGFDACEMGQCGNNFVTYTDRYVNEYGRAVYVQDGPNRVTKSNVYVPLYAKVSLMLKDNLRLGALDIRNTISNQSNPTQKQTEISNSITGSNLCNYKSGDPKDKDVYCKVLYNGPLCDSNGTCKKSTNGSKTIFIRRNSLSYKNGNQLLGGFDNNYKEEKLCGNQVIADVSTDSGSGNSNVYLEQKFVKKGGASIYNSDKDSKSSGTIKECSVVNVISKDCNFGQNKSRCKISYDGQDRYIEEMDLTSTSACVPEIGDFISKDYLNDNLIELDESDYNTNYYLIILYQDGVTNYGTVSFAYKDGEKYVDTALNEKIKELVLPKNGDRKFLGYNTKKELNGKTVINSKGELVSDFLDILKTNGTVDNAASNVYYLYPIFEGENVIVTYDAQGGSKCNNKTVGYQDTYGELCTPTKKGYKFNGWFNKEAKVTSETVVNIKDNVKLTASWEPYCLLVRYFSNYATDSFTDGLIEEVSSSKNAKVFEEKYCYDVSQPNGLRDDIPAKSGRKWLLRDGYKATGSWIVLDNPNLVVSQATKFDTAQEMAKALGVSIDEKDIIVDVQAEWEETTCSKENYNSCPKGILINNKSGASTSISSNTATNKNTGVVYGGAEIYIIDKVSNYYYVAIETSKTNLSGSFEQVSEQKYTFAYISTNALSNK